MSKQHVVIIGNGISGISTALSLRKQQPSWEITVISGESDHHYSRPALMYIFMGHMCFADTKPYPDSFWRTHAIDLRRAWVNKINSADSRLELDDGSSLAYDHLVLALGSKSNKFGWPGQNLDGAQGLHSLQDLELLEENLEHKGDAVIVGGGLIGIELGEMLHSRGRHVTYLVRESSYWNNILTEEESQMINGVIRDEGMDLVLSTNLKEIVDDGSGRVSAVRTEFGDEISCSIVGLTPGVSPQLSLVEGTEIETARGIRVDPHFRTNVENIYALGDCAELVDEDGAGRVEQLWYTGRRQGEFLGKILAGETIRYTPDIFFNSAKFFDLEFQTYGLVRHPVEGERHVFWQDSSGRHSLRLVYSDAGVIGVNVMGIRHRHRVWETWLREKRDPSDVLGSLKEANFDPEFSHSYEQEIVGSLQEQLR